MTTLLTYSFYSLSFEIILPLQIFYIVLQPLAKLKVISETSIYNHLFNIEK